MSEKSKQIAFDAINELGQCILDKNAAEDYLEFQQIGNFYACTKLKDEFKFDELEIVVPNQYNKMPVVVVAQRAFQNSSITSVVIPRGVQQIGNYAFGECYNLEKVYIPDTVTMIEPFAFYNCKKLEFVRLSSNLNYCTKEAFSGCDNLKRMDNVVKLKNDVHDYFLKKGIEMNRFDVKDEIDENTLSMEEKLSLRLSLMNHGIVCEGFKRDLKNTEIEVVVPPSLEGLPVNFLCAYAFANSDVVAVYLPEDIKEIKAGTFNNCYKLERLGMPGVTKIDSRALQNCPNLKMVTISRQYMRENPGAFSDCLVIEMGDGDGDKNR